MAESRVIGELSARGLSNICSEESDFAFVSDGAEVRCSRFKAQFLSRKVCSLLRSDPLIDRLEVDIQTNHKSIIQSFLSQLLETGQIAIPTSTIPVLSEFSRFVENTELLEVLKKNSFGSVDENNVVQRLMIFATEEDIGFLASHFSTVSKQPSMASLSFDVISNILNHSELRLESEDSLFRFIESLCSKDDNYRDLIESVETRYLSDSCIEDYVSFVDPDRLSRGTWLSICRRLTLPVSPPTPNPRLKLSLARVDTVSYGGDTSSMFRGIFHRMSEECKGNPHSCGQVKVSANQEMSGCKLQVYDLICTSDKSGKYWGARGESSERFIKFEFPSSRICPSGYSLKAHNAAWARQGYYIRSWRFEGSNDDSEWTIVDRQNDTDAISANDKEAYFGISTSAPYRFLRIITGTSDSSGTNQWSMQQIEIFGQIHSSSSV
jgi:hypothetical protein